MDSLISRQAAIDGKISIQRANGVEIYSDEAVPVEYLKRLQPAHPEVTYEQVVEYCKKRCMHLVTDDFFHTIQPERKKGEWIEISSINHTYKCSECGRLLVNVADGRNNVSKHYPYCHCGADMKGERQK